MYNADRRRIFKKELDYFHYDWQLVERLNERERSRPQRVDAHKTDAHRNVSVFLQHAFELRGQTSECALQLQILEETSSGGHKFKVRTVTLSTN